MTAAHTLTYTVIGSRFDTIEAEVAQHVARYTGWPFADARRHVTERATVELRPIARRPRVGVIYEATVKVTV